MRAAVIHEYGETPRVEEFREPEAEERAREDGHRRVVVDIELAGLNPVDIAIASGAFHSGAPNLPTVVGLEGVGRVDGGPLCYFGGAAAPYGSFAEKALVDSSRLIELPPDVDPAQAIAFGIAGQAGWLSLAWRAELQHGEKVAILGATGMVGEIAIHAARWLGAGAVVAIGRNEERLEHARSVGASAVVQMPADASELTGAIRDAADGPVDVVVDLLWGEPAMASLEALAPLGRLIQIGNSSGEPVASLAAGKVRGQAREIRGHTNGLAPEEIRRDAYLEMCRQSAIGDLRVETEEVPLDDITSAWERQQSSPGRKLVIRP